MNDDGQELTDLGTAAHRRHARIEPRRGGVQLSQMGSHRGEGGVVVHVGHARLGVPLADPGDEVRDTQ